MKDNYYPFFSSLIMKRGVFNSPYYYFKVPQTSKSGIINEDLYKLIILCNGANNLKHIKKVFIILLKLIIRIKM